MGTMQARWVPFDSGNSSLESWLRDWKPSAALSPAVEWLCVSRLRANSAETNRVQGLIAGWKALCAAKTNKMNCNDVERLAEEHKLLSGKWLIYVPAKDVDETWSLIAKAVVDGKLGNDAKVSTSRHGLPVKVDSDKGADCKPPSKTRKLKSSDIEPDHVICVYSNNFQDDIGVFEMRDKLRQLGFNDKLRYKPDAYSFCGIYSENQWGIPPTIFYE